jgi:hypothetical protein
MPAQPTTQRPAADPTPHHTHDLQLLASVADHDLDPATRADLDAMVAACPDCAEIAAELRFLAAGLADLPSDVPAPHDFRLSPEQAARARRGGIWRSLLRPFGVDGLPGLRPLAGALTALGLAGLILTSFPLGFGSSGAALPAEHATTGSYDSGAGAQGPATSPNVAVAPQAGASAAAGAGGGGKGEATSVPPYALQSAPTDALGVDRPSGNLTTVGSPAGQAHVPSAPSAGPSVPPLSVVSTALLVAGLALAALRLVARRIG